MRGQRIPEEVIVQVAQEIADEEIQLITEADAITSASDAAKDGIVIAASKYWYEMHQAGRCGCLGGLHRALGCQNLEDALLRLGPIRERANALAARMEQFA